MKNSLKHFAMLMALARLTACAPPVNQSWSAGGGIGAVPILGPSGPIGP